MARSKNGKLEVFRGPGRPRGVTRARYKVLWTMVHKGLATWPDLERRNLCLTPGGKSDYRQHVERLLKSRK